MIGPSPVQSNYLNRGDIIKVVSDDGSFKATIQYITKEGDIVLERIKDKTEFIIDFIDLYYYDLYPQGDTIAKVQKRLLEKSNCSKGAIAPKEQKVFKEPSQDIGDDEIRFFKSFEQYQKTSLGDKHQADMLLTEMIEIADQSNNKELYKAIKWVKEERIKAVNESYRSQ